MEIIINSWAIILLALLTAADAIVSLTPSKRDDQIVGYLKIIVQTISGKRKNK
jgi:hypothetical protein